MSPRKLLIVSIKERQWDTRIDSFAQIFTSRSWLDYFYFYDFYYVSYGTLLWSYISFACGTLLWRGIHRGRTFFMNMEGMTTRGKCLHQILSPTLKSGTGTWVVFFNENCLSVWSRALHCILGMLAILSTSSLVGHTPIKQLQNQLLGPLVITIVH